MGAELGKLAVRAWTEEGSEEGEVSRKEEVEEGQGSGRCGSKSSKVWAPGGFCSSLPRGSTPELRPVFLQLLGPKVTKTADKQRPETARFQEVAPGS